MNIVIIGKFSTIFSVLIGLTLLKLLNYLSKKNNERLLTFLLSVCFLSSLIFFFLEKNLYKIINVGNIFSGRNKLWIDYINYIIMNIKTFLFGNGFNIVREKISYLSHPHNQYLEIFFTLGCFSFLANYLFFLKLKNKIVEYKNGNEDLMLLFITLIIMMCGDDYFLLTVYQIPLIIYMLIYNIKFKKVNNCIAYYRRKK